MQPPLPTFIELCKDELEDPMLIVLMIAGAISIILGIIDGHGWVEGVAILVAVVVVTCVGAFNNLSQAKEFRRLDDERDENMYKGTPAHRLPWAWKGRLQLC